MTLPVGTTIYEWTSNYHTPPSVYTTTLAPPLGDTLYNMYGEGIGHIDSTEAGSYPTIYGTIIESEYQGTWERTGGDTTSTTVQSKGLNYVSTLSNGTDTYTIKDSEARAEVYVNGKNWYVLWENGYCEQGGYVASTSNNATKVTINLLKPYVNTQYTVLKTFQSATSYTSGINSSIFGPLYIYYDSFQTYSGDQRYFPGFYWKTCGFVK